VRRSGFQSKARFGFVVAAVTVVAVITVVMTVAPAAAATPVNACAVVSFADLERATGIAFPPGGAATPQDAQSCEFQAVGSSGRVGVAIDFDVSRAQRASAGDEFEHDRKTLPAVNEIDFLGDRAFFARGGAVVNRADRTNVQLAESLYVLGGDHAFLVTVVRDAAGGGFTYDRTAEQRIARLALDSIGYNSRRANVFGTFPDPTRISLSAKTLSASAGIAGLLVFLMGFPSELFNRTLEQNEERVRRRFGRLAVGTARLRAVLDRRTQLQ
jgi:hypothetical protein